MTAIERLEQNWAAPGNPKPITIVGAGGIVRDAHLPAYRQAGLTVGAVTDVDADRRNALAADHGIGSVYESVAAAVAAMGTDCVYDVAVPPVATLDVLRDLPEQAAVLIQKPMGTDLANAREIRALCRKRKLKAAMNFQLRFSPMMMAARQAIANGLIGDPLEIEVHLNIFTPWTLFPFLMSMRRVEILVHSIHYLDSIRALFGTPKGVFARSMGDPRAPGFAQTRTSVILDWGDQRRGLMSINHNHQAGRKFQSAWFRVEGTEAAMMIKLGVCFDYPRGEADELWFCPNSGEWRQVPLTGSWFIDSFMGPMRNVQRFDAGEDDRLFSGVEDAFETMALAEACFDAMERPTVPLQLD